MFIVPMRAMTAAIGCCVACVRADEDGRAVAVDEDGRDVDGTRGLGGAGGTTVSCGRGRAASWGWCDVFCRTCCLGADGRTCAVPEVPVADAFVAAFTVAARRSRSTLLNCRVISSMPICPNRIVSRILRLSSSVNSVDRLIRCMSNCR